MATTASTHKQPSESLFPAINGVHAAEPARNGHFENAVTALEVVGDLLAICAAVLASNAIYTGLDIGKQIHYQRRELWTAAFAFGVFFVLMLDRVGAYRVGSSLLRVKETERVLRVSMQSFLLLFAVSFFSQIYVSRWLILIGFVTVPLVVASEKHGVYALIRYLHSRGYGVRRVVVYGSGYTGRRVFSALMRSPKLGLEPVALVDDDPAKVGKNIFELSYHRRRSATVLKGPPSPKLLRRVRANHLVVAIPSLDREKFLKVVSAAFSAAARVSFVPNQFWPSDSPVDHTNIDGLLLSSLRQPAGRPGYEALKHVFDAVVSVAVLVAAAPFWLLIAFFIRRDSSGPILFRQQRVGRNGVVFNLYKFRTMYADTPPYDYSPKDADDHRITRIGRFLRRTSLDELPQLLNVIRGEMSLVGPRPEMPFIVAQYTDWQRQRTQVKPGITGLWQLSGDRAYLIHENIEYDLYYIRHRNFFMDLAILLHTVLFAMRGI